MEQFNLSDFVSEIRAIAQRNKCSEAVAVDRMVMNLNTFNEYYRGTGELNYHVLGHYWGALPANIKVEQKNAAKQLVSEPSIRKRRRS